MRSFCPLGVMLVFSLISSCAVRSIALHDQIPIQVENGYSKFVIDSKLVYVSDKLKPKPTVTQLRSVLSQNKKSDLANQTQRYPTLTMDLPEYQQEIRKIALMGEHNSTIVMSTTSGQANSILLKPDANIVIYSIEDPNLQIAH